MTDIIPEVTGVHVRREAMSVGKDVAEWHDMPIGWVKTRAGKDRHVLVHWEDGLWVARTNAVFLAAGPTREAAVRRLLQRAKHDKVSIGYIWTFPTWDEMIRRRHGGAKR